ncbi:MAG: hypothetical protein ACKOA5_06985 [Actinomycetota bacterium]
MSGATKSFAGCRCIKVNRARVFSDNVFQRYFSFVERIFNCLISSHRGLQRRMDVFDGRLKLAISAGLAFALAMIAMQVQIVISIANL